MKLQVRCFRWVRLVRLVVIFAAIAMTGCASGPGGRGGVDSVSQSNAVPQPRQFADTAPPANDYRASLASYNSRSSSPRRSSGFWGGC